MTTKAKRQGVRAVHPMRRRIVALMRDGNETTTSELSGILEETIGAVAYHVRALAEKGVLVETRKEQRRGAVATYYVLDQEAAKVIPDVLVDVALEAVAFLEGLAVSYPNAAEAPFDLARRLRAAAEAEGA